MRALGVQLSDWERIDFDADAGDIRPALTFLLSLYRLARGERLLVVGCGSSAHDTAVLELADVPVVVRGETERETARLLELVPTALQTNEPGPRGWCEAVLSLLEVMRRGDEQK